MNTIIYKIAAITLIISTLAFSAYTPIPQSNSNIAHAGIAGDVIGGAAGCAAGIGIGALVGNLLGSFGLSVSVKDGEALVKDQVLDCIAWIFANIALEAITTATVNWINSGFEGNPAYVDDFEGFLKDIGDQAIGDFIQNSELEFLCSPFKINIKASLLQRDRFDHRVTCTLSDVVDNVEGFVEGNFNEGGWQGWFELTQKPQNNPYAIYIEANSEFTRRLARAVGVEETQLDLGKGFLSREKCEVVGTEPLPEGQDGPPAPITKCEIVTPGSVIDNQLNDVLTIGGRRLSIADELNEVLGALFSQLIGKIFSNDPDEGGLKGSSNFVNRVIEEGGTSVLPGDEDLEQEPGPEEGGNPTGSCDFGSSTLSSRAQDTVTDVSRFPRSGRGSQIVFLDGGQYQIDTRVNGVRTTFGPRNTIRRVGNEFCVVNGPCTGGALVQADQDSVLALDTWAESGGNRAVALRFETDGVHIDWYSQQAGGTGQFPPQQSITAAVAAFCAAASVPNE